MDMHVVITPNETPKGKLADVELHFSNGPLNGLKLVGFAIWQRRGSPGFNVTLPSRVYHVNGEARSFALLRPMADQNQMDALKATIIKAYQFYVAENQP